jgi:hypothetical protein
MTRSVKVRVSNTTIRRPAIAYRRPGTVVRWCARCGHRLLTAEDAYYHDCSGARGEEPEGGRNLKRPVMTLTRVERDGLDLYYDVPALGDGVAEHVVSLIRLFADRAGLSDLPPITLQGEGWERPWAACAAHKGVGGQAGSSREEERHGDHYTCFILWFTAPSPYDPDDDQGPATLVRTVAHEVTHLRWWGLRHGPEFSARVRALLAGAQFPARGGWSRKTIAIVAAERENVRAWFRAKYGGRGDEPGRRAPS